MEARARPVVAAVSPGKKTSMGRPVPEPILTSWCAVDKIAMILLQIHNETNILGNLYCSVSLAGFRKFIVSISRYQTRDADMASC
jgi:hypothetical protein